MKPVINGNHGTSNSTPLQKRGDVRNVTIHPDTDARALYYEGLGMDRIRDKFSTRKHRDFVEITVSLCVATGQLILLIIEGSFRQRRNEKFVKIALIE